MPSETVTIRATEGGAFDCYQATPAGGDAVPAVVLACSIDGVDTDLRQIADEFAAAGFIAVAPDLFWRTIPGPLPSGDPRTRERAQPRLEKITINERDLMDTLAYLRTLPRCNGHAAVMGFCYGGPFAILGPKRLGYDAGIACHGSQMFDYLNELDGVTAPVCLSGAIRTASHRRRAGCLWCRGVAHDQHRGAHFSGHPARLHDAE